MRLRKSKLDSIKKDLHNQWIIISRLPFLVLFASSLIGGMALIVWIVTHLVNCILGV